MKRLILSMGLLPLLAAPAFAVQWDVLREDSPGEFAPVGNSLAATTLIGGVAVFDDGFAADGSDWGDDESAAISAQQQSWQETDPLHRAFSCSWHHGS